MTDNDLKNISINNYCSSDNIPKIFILNINGIRVAFMLTLRSLLYTPENAYISHSHFSFQLQYIKSDNLISIMENKRQIILNSGDLILIPPKMIHKSLKHSANDRCYINFTVISEDIDAAENINIDNLKYYTEFFSNIKREIVFRNEEIEHCINKIFDCEQNNINKSLSSKHYLSILFLELTDSLSHIVPFSSIHNIEDVFHQNEIDNFRKYIIDAYVTNYYTLKDHVNNLSNILRLSPRHTIRIVKELTGHSLQELILSQKMNVAKELILNNAVSLKDIAIFLGYETYTGFYMAFTRYYGYSPERTPEK